MGEKNTFEEAMKVFKLDTSAPTREQIEYIDIDKIDGDARNFYELSGLEALAANIELCGLQQPIRVRTSPNKPSRVIIVSGHRRKAALQMLVDEGKEQFREVPCIREESPKSWALQELRLIYANSDTRKLSSADLAKQAERVEELLYQLKEEGMEFPGRMRDHVAQACQTSKSKLARLKVIRENLLLDLENDWESGKFSDQAAYALARMPDWMQDEFIGKPGKHEFGGDQCEKILAAADQYVKPTVSCPDGGEACKNGDLFLQHDVRDKYSYNLCKGERCCFSCAYRRNCKFSCDKVKRRIADEQAEREKATALRREEEQDRSNEILRDAEEFWGRVDDICMARRIRLEDAAQILLPYSKRLPDKILTGEHDREFFSYLEVGMNGCKEILELCGMLGVSADELLGLGPDAGAVKASWKTGKPRDSGLFYARFVLDGMEYDLPVWYDAVLDAFYHSKGGAKADGELIGWYPLPMDEDGGESHA